MIAFAPWTPAGPRGLTVPATAQLPTAQPPRLTRRGRQVRALLLAGVAAAVLVLLAPAVARAVGNLGSGTPLPASAPASVVVRPGDSLWSIATRIGPGHDPRAVVAYLSEHNHLHGATLYAGQRLLVAQTAR